MKYIRWCGKNWFLFSFKRKKKYVLSKNIRQQENVTIKVILNLWQCFVPFVFIACQGTCQKMKEKTGWDAQSTCNGYMEKFFICRLVLFSKNKIVEGTKTNWSFLLEYVVMMLNYLIWFPISYFDSSMFSIFHNITLSLLNWRWYLILNYQTDTRNKFLFLILSRNLLIWWWYKVFGTHLWNFEFMYQNRPSNWCV